MPRIIELALFLTPFLGFAVWRLLFPSPTPPVWLVAGLGVLVALLLAGLLWTWQGDARDGQKAYVPAIMQDGRIIPGHAAPKP